MYCSLVSLCKSAEVYSMHTQKQRSWQKRMALRMQQQNWCLQKDIHTGMTWTSVYLDFLYRSHSTILACEATFGLTYKLTSKRNENFEFIRNKCFRWFQTCHIYFARQYMDKEQWKQVILIEFNINTVNTCLCWHHCLVTTQSKTMLTFEWK